MLPAEQFRPVPVLVLVVLATTTGAVLPSEETDPRDGIAAASTTAPASESEVRNVTPWVASRNVTVRDATDVDRLRSSGRLVRSDTVAIGDTLVLAVEVEGVEDAVTGADNATAGFFDAFAGETGSVRVVQTRDSLRPEEEPLRLDLADPNATRVVPDRANDTYYLVVDTADLRSTDGRGEDVTDRLHSRLRYDRVGFRLNVTRHPDGSNGSASSSTAVVSIAPPRVALDVDRTARERDDVERIWLRPDARQPVTGTTRLAPGRNVTVTLSVPRGDSHSKTVRVGPNGTFVARFDLEGVPDDTDGTVRARPAGVPDLEVDVTEESGDTAGVRVDVPEASVALAAQETTTGRYDDGVAVRELSLSRGGFVVLRRGSADGPVVGVSDYLPPGEYATLTLRELSFGGSGTVTVVATVHRDGDDDAEFDRTTDPPFRRNGSPVRDRATVEVIQPTTTTTSTTTATTATTETTATDDGTTETGGETTGTDDGTTGTDGGASEPVPGFGVAGGLLGIALAIALYRRR